MDVGKIKQLYADIVNIAISRPDLTALTDIHRSYRPPAAQFAELRDSPTGTPD